MKLSFGRRRKSALPSSVLFASVILFLLVVFVHHGESLAITSAAVCNCKNNLVPYFQLLEVTDDYSAADSYHNDDQLCGKKGRLATIRTKDEYDCMIDSIFNTVTPSSLYWVGGRQNNDASPFTWDCNGQCDHDGLCSAPFLCRLSSFTFCSFLFFSDNYETCQQRQASSFMTNRFLLVVSRNTALSALPNPTTMVVLSSASTSPQMSRAL